MIHWLKTDPEYFQLVWDGDKQYEIRLNDRDYQIDDILILADGTQTARAERAVIARVVSRLGDNFPGIGTGFVGLGLLILGKIYGDDMDLYEYSRTTWQCKEWRGVRKAQGVQQ